MCGICGYVNKKLIDTSILTRMNDTMYHRGPDDSGEWEIQMDDYAVGLAQRRLSILDLSELGHQPMVSSFGDAIITYNGEIYNFMELRAELEKKSYSFISTCDTEVILAAYQEWGTDCFARFNGMFAIAIYDHSSDRLIMARDRMGKKPLYYYHKGDDFVFASELKPIMNYPYFSKNIDQSVIGMYLCNKCIMAPKTIFMDTYKLEPGTYLVLDCKSKNVIEQKPYWNLIEIFNNTEKKIHTLDEAKTELRDLLRDSVSKRLVADVPVGTFLSGGIDSTLISAVAQEVKGSPVDSFTIGFYDEERNEAPYAKDIAKHIGTNHHELYMTDEEILGQVKDIVKYYDEPFSDSSQIPCMLVSRVARDNVTVSLSGDGGDEMCCGYSMYDYNRMVQNLDFLGAIEYHMPWNKLLSKKLPPYGRAFINNRDERYKTQLFADLFVEEAQKILKVDVGNVKSEKEQLIDTKNHQEKRMILDMVDYLPSDILAKMDRAAMKYSLEVRCPLLDHRIPEWSFGVDHDLKYHGKEKKYLLKQLTYEYVPKELLDRPKKGFGVPLKKWVQTVLKPEIDRVSEKELLDRQGIFDYEGLNRLKEVQAKTGKTLYAHILWGFYVFQMWYNEYIEEIL